MQIQGECAGALSFVRPAGPTRPGPAQGDRTQGQSSVRSQPALHRPACARSASRFPAPARSSGADRPSSGRRAPGRSRSARARRRVHSVTSSPVSSRCTPPRRVPAAACRSKACSTSPRMLSKRRVLKPLPVRLGVAVHRVADPQHAAAVALHRLQQRRQLALRSAPRPCDGSSVSRPGSSSGLSTSIRRSSWSGVTDGPTFTAIGLRMPRKYSTCAPSSAAVRMPIHGKCVLRLNQPHWRGTWRVSASS